MMKPESVLDIEPQPISVEGDAGNVDDCLTSFTSEHERATHPPQRVSRMPVVVIGVCLALSGAWFAWQTRSATAAATALSNPVAATGTAVFTSVPDGASITIDGKTRGGAPFRVQLPAGTHSVQITSGPMSSTLPITAESGGVASQHVELAAAQAAADGRLEIGSEPPGALVVLDGISKGVTPLVIADAAAGQHRVTVSAGGNSVNRTVNVTPGATATLVVSIAPAPVAADSSAGWLTVQAPMDLDIMEDGRILGSTRMERVMLPVGSHRIELANPALEFTTARTVQIAAGRTANVAVARPSGRLSVNAIPWADVSLDGVSLGTTPLGELSVPIGAHELVFRHPQLGERRQTVTVKAQTPARIGIDLRK
jgi:eukaryotic-like serine/threonine-protein kinase